MIRADNFVLASDILNLIINDIEDEMFESTDLIYIRRLEYVKSDLVKAVVHLSPIVTHRFNELALGSHETYNV